MPRAPRRPLVPLQAEGDGPKPPPKPPQGDPYYSTRNEAAPGSFMDRMTEDNRKQRPVISFTWVCLDSDGRPSGHANYEWMGPIGGSPTCPTCGGNIAIQLDALQPAAVQVE
jgi:hypothetical protein